MKQFQIKLKGIVVFDDTYLLLKRWYDDCIAQPFQWMFVDGSLDFGEKPEQAVERLVREQAGLDTVAEKLLYTWTYVVGDVQYIGIAYLCRAFSNEVQMAEEFEEYRFVEREALSELITNQMVLADIERELPEV